MNECEYKLVVEPTESRVALNENDSYTYRVPLILLQGHDQNVLQTILDTAGVAFGHNKPGSKNVIVTCPQGSAGDINWLIESLHAGNLNVHVRQQVASKFVDLNIITNCGLGCVDRRLDDVGVDPVSKTAQITHAGGALVLHPQLRAEMPAHHVATLERGLSVLADHGAPVGKIDYHFGAGGAGGCGMYGLLASKNSAIREHLRTPEDIIDMLRRIREACAKVLTTDCGITGSVVYKDLSGMAYNLDDKADTEALRAEKDLVL